MGEKREEGGWQRWAGYAALVLLALVLYVLSLGPFLLLCDRMGWGRSAVSVVYAPMIWLYDNTPLQGPLDWYVSLWSGSDHRPALIVLLRPRRREAAQHSRDRGMALRVRRCDNSPVGN